MKKSLGIYVHIPFCIKKCNYCDFCSFPQKTDKMSDYSNEICERISEYSNRCGEYIVDTVYFGGGTPTLLPLEDFEKIIGAINKSFLVVDNCEITAECNPASADREYLTELRKMGVNRISIGLQSVHDGELSALGRSHDFSDFLSIYDDARRAGFENISVDLMYGIPEQTLDSFRESLETLCKLRPEHISAYGLKIEKNTPFYKKRHSLVLPDEDTEYEMYISITEILKKYGYKKYEISNFCLDGYESRHNLRYWRGLEYLGFGVAAYSFFGNERFGNSYDLDGFLSGKDIKSESVILSEKDLKNDYIMLSLRLAEGIDLADAKRVWGLDLYEYYPKIKELVKMGYMKENNGKISFTDKGFFVSNSILSDMLDFG